MAQEEKETHFAKGGQGVRRRRRCLIIIITEHGLRVDRGAAATALGWQIKSLDGQWYAPPPPPSPPVVLLVVKCRHELTRSSRPILQLLLHTTTPQLLLGRDREKGTYYTLLSRREAKRKWSHWRFPGEWFIILSFLHGHLSLPRVSLFQLQTVCRVLTCCHNK